MARLYLFAEGQTEQTFADNLIKNHLAAYQVWMQKPRLIAKGKKKGKMHRGGGQNYQPMKKDILRSLKEDQNTDAFFTTMIDLYAIYSDFPGLEESKRFIGAPKERVEFLEACFKDDIGDERFIPYLQLHEYEAYLFVDPTCLQGIYEGNSREIERLCRIAEQYETPELINDGFDTAPSKRIIQHLPSYKKAKAVFGPQIAQAITLPRIREKCPHFNEWMIRLEALGKVGSTSADGL